MLQKNLLHQRQKEKRSRKIYVCVCVCVCNNLINNDKKKIEIREVGKEESESFNIYIYNCT